MQSTAGPACRRHVCECSIRGQSIYFCARGPARTGSQQTLSPGHMMSSAFRLFHTKPLTSSFSVRESENPTQTSPPNINSRDQRFVYNTKSAHFLRSEKSLLYSLQHAVQQGFSQLQRTGNSVLDSEQTIKPPLSLSRKQSPTDTLTD
eukprot:scpid55573/ scgid7327/ 